MSIEREAPAAPVDAGLPENVVDGELWGLVQTVRARHRPADAAETCTFCAEPWPCQAEQLAMVADVASRMPPPLPRSA